MVRTGERTDLVDIDELLEAHRHGLVSSATAEAAVRRRAVAVAEGLARHDHDLGAWLAAQGYGSDLARWREPGGGLTAKGSLATP